MTAQPPAAPSALWDTDVLEFAAKEKVAAYLEPLHEAVGRAYPTVKSVKVWLSEDPELRDVKCVVFEVEVPLADAPDYLAARRRWEEELFRICPAPLVSHFCFDLRRVD